MEQKLAKLLCGVKCEPDCDLTDNICLAIARYDQRARRFKFWLFSVIGFGSLLSLVPAVKILSADLSQSGFFDYFSLLSPGLSPDAPMFSYWREISMSILESIPALSIMLSFTLIFIFFLSLKFALKQNVRSYFSLSF